MELVYEMLQTRKDEVLKLPEEGDKEKLLELLVDPKMRQKISYTVHQRPEENHDISNPDIIRNFFRIRND